MEDLLEKALRLPLKPGVYLMLDAQGAVIYVGKAKKLKNRVSSYFHGAHLPKVAAMVEKVADFQVIVAGSEFEALVLENSLIKRHKPHYNILLKDDKGYPFIRVDRKTEYPRMEIASRAKKDGAEYYGPFGGRSRSREIIDAVSSALKLPDCARSFPRDIGKDRPCLNYHMDRCLGWCLKDADAGDYRTRVEQAVLILQGKSGELTDALTKEMLEASEALRFERAAELRDRIRAIEGLQNRQRVIATAFHDLDAVGFQRGAKSCFTVLHFSDGDLTEKDVEMLDEPLEDDSEVIADLVRQYYTAEGTVPPKTVLLPCELEGAEDLEQLIQDVTGRRIRLEVPKRGERLRLVESARLNAQEEILRRTTQEQRRSKTLEWLQRALELPEFPQRIEAFDISNLGDMGIVAAMTVFRDGKPLKSAYRKFRMKGQEHQDDYASMYEAVTRRFQRYLDGDEKFAPLPELLLIDGGEMHTRTAVSALRELGLTVPCFGMVKDDRHRTRALVTEDGEEIGIAGNQAVFSLIGNIQEETHRSAIGYQRSLRNEGLRSQLDGIEGIGPKRRNDLLRQFHSVKAIREADLEALCGVLPKNAAKKVYEYFHGEQETGEEGAANESERREACESSPGAPEGEN